MECKKVRDRLITEYTDKELDPEGNAEIERHLNACPDCRGFWGAIQRNAVTPFKEVGDIQPENAVWQRIQEKIEMERAHAGGGFWKLVDALASRFPMPVPLVRAAFVTSLILGVVVLAKWPSSYADPVYGYLSEQMTFMSGLKTGDTDLLNGELSDYDIFFEEIGS